MVLCAQELSTLPTDNLTSSAKNHRDAVDIFHKTRQLFFFSQNCSDFGSSFVNSTKTCGKYIYIYCDNVLLNEADS